MYPLKFGGIVDQDTGPTSKLDISEGERPIVSQYPLGSWVCAVLFFRRKWSHPLLLPVLWCLMRICERESINSRIHTEVGGEVVTWKLSWLLLGQVKDHLAR